MSEAFSAVPRERDDCGARGEIHILPVQRMRFAGAHAGKAQQADPCAHLFLLKGAHLMSPEPFQAVSIEYGLVSLVPFWFDLDREKNSPA